MTDNVIETKSRITNIDRTNENLKSVLDDPRQVIRIANEYANTGFEWITNKIVGNPDSSLTLLHSINEFL